MIFKSPRVVNFSHSTEENVILQLNMKITKTEDASFLPNNVCQLHKSLSMTLARHQVNIYKHNLHTHACTQPSAG